MIINIFEVFILQAKGRPQQEPAQIELVIKLVFEAPRDEGQDNDGL